MIHAINTFITTLNTIGGVFWRHAADISIQVTLLILILLIVNCLLRKRVRAVVLYCLWMLLLVKLVLPGSFALPTGIGNWAGDYFRTRTAAQPAPPPYVESAAIPAINIPNVHIPVNKSPTAAADSGISFVPIQWQGLVFAAWLIGMLALTVVLIRRICYIRKLVARSIPADKRLTNMLSDCQRLVGVRRSIRVRASDHALSPAVCGLFKPVILIPRTFLEILAPDKLKTVLVHELAHIKRADLWVDLAQTLLQIVHFYNPLVWTANAMVRRVREQAVDEMVLVTLRPETRSYSNTLIEIAEMAFWRPDVGLNLIGVAESKKALERRIKHMLNRPVPKTSRLGRLALVAIIAVGAVIVPMGCSRSAQTTHEPVTIVRSTDNTIVPFERVGDYKIGMTKDEILQKLGKPRNIFYGGNKYTLKNLPRAYFMSFGDVSFMVVDETVTGITALHPFYKLPNGLGVGSSLQDVKKAFGDGNQEKANKWKDFLYYGDEGLMFEIHRQKKTVLEINISDKGFGTWQKAELPPTSIIDEDGRIVDKIDHPFVDDPQLVGTWKSVDFVHKTEQFKAGRKHWPDNLFLKELVFLPNGRTSKPWQTWTKGLIFHSGDKTAAKYTIKEIKGDTYMFFEWKSGDYIIRHRRPAYYVLRKTSSDTGGLADSWAEQLSNAEFAAKLPAMIEQLDIDTADLKQVIEIFGRPGQYVWGSETFTEADLPVQYVMFYPAHFSIYMREDKIVELRHGSGSTYVLDGKLRQGATLEEVFQVVGAPEKTVVGKENRFQDGVLYKDFDGRKGLCYYARHDKNLRLWFRDYKLSGIYMTSSLYNETAPSKRGLLGLQINDKTWPVIDVVPGMPAEKAGIKNGDKVIKINNEDIAHIKTLHDALKVLNGAPGEKIDLTVQRGDQTLDFTVKRAQP